MPEIRPPIELHGISIADLEKRIKERRLPPVDQWNPQHCGHSGMRIARDGTWYHENSPIRRPEMVRLFSTILRREPDGRHLLVTPVERLDIDVESTAFRAVEMRRDGEGSDQILSFRLDNDEVVILGRSNPLHVLATDHGPSPRLFVRHGLEAELTRSVYYELADIALAAGTKPAGIWSDHCFYSLECGG